MIAELGDRRSCDEPRGRHGPRLAGAHRVVRCSGRRSDLLWTREGLVLSRRSGSSCCSWVEAADQPDLAGGGLGGGAVRGVVFGERGDVAEAARDASGAGLRLRRRAASHRLHARKRPTWSAALALFVEDELRAGRPLVSGASASPRASSSRSARRTTACECAGQAPAPKRGHVSVSVAGNRHPFAVRPAGAAGDDRRARRIHRLSDGRPAFPALASDAAAGDRDPPRAAARPDLAAAGISRPARLPARR